MKVGRWAVSYRAVGGNFQENWALEKWAVSYRAVGGNFHHLNKVPK
jgi:hypothetical protein